jgi:hypothetical protein
VQTFMPMISYRASADALDNVRQNNQINECKAIFMTLAGLSDAWSNHPATRMWKGHELALLAYGGTVAAAYRDRKGLAYEKRQAWFFEMSKEHKSKFSARSVLVPPWVGDLNFHRSHRSSLLSKDPEYYGDKGWGDIPDRMPLLWPRSDKGGLDYGLYLSNSDRAKVKAGELVLPEWLYLESDGEVVEVDDDDEEAAQDQELLR